MLGFGRKDANGDQTRIEPRGRHTRASRTGGASVRAQGKIGKTNATVNSKHGLRLSRKVAKGTQINLQNGRLGVRGRYGKGRLKTNLSKSGLSFSWRARRGSFNITRPARSSFKIAGMQFRGKTAVNLHIIFGIIDLGILCLKLLWLPFGLVIALLLTAFSSRQGDQDEGAVG